VEQVGVSKEQHSSQLSAQDEQEASSNPSTSLKPRSLLQQTPWFAHVFSAQHSALVQPVPAHTVLGCLWY
jgi:hypothetical protein